MPIARPLRRLALLTLVVSVGLAAPACSKSDGGSGGSAEVGDAATVDGATSTTAATSTSTAVGASTTTTTAVAAPLGVDTPEHAAQALYDAWKAGDRVAAAQVAEPAAIDAVWLTAPGDYAVYNKCDTGEFDTSGCLFRGDTGTIQFDLAKGPTGRWVVEGAFYADA